MGLWGLLVIVTLLAVLVLAVLGCVWLYRRLRAEQHNAGTVDHDSARAKLRERYAAGEIDDEEYERRLSGLSTWR
ncbi:MAG: SHOCT domain-containing protein [Pseudonocardiaceae bacterium]